MPIKSLNPQRDALGQALREHLGGDEHVREWVSGRTWPEVLVSRSQARYIVLTNRRVLGLVGDARAVTLEWDATPASVVATTLRRLLVVRRPGAAETRLLVDQPFRKQATALAAAL